jgi:hypothetical protein
MDDLLGSLVRGRQKRTILCHWGWVVTNGIRAISQPEMGGPCTSPWGSLAGTCSDAKNGVIPWRSSAGTLGPKRGWLWHPTSSRNDDVLICINASFMTQRVLKPWWPWTYPNSAVKRASARVIPGWVTSWETWFGGAKSGQYCVIEGRSLHRCWGRISFPNQKPTNHF